MDSRAKARERYARVLGDAALARKLEKATKNATIDWCKSRGIPESWDIDVVRWWYAHKVLSIEFNLKTNPALLGKVLSGEVLAYRDPRADPGADARLYLFDMKPWEMKPELWEAAFENAARIRMRHSDFAPDPAKVPDGAFQCGKCKSKKTVYYEMQTRAADEPMTLFIRCVMCGSRWKK